MKAKKLDNFEYIERFTHLKGERAVQWDENFINISLKKHTHASGGFSSHGGNNIGIQKVWVCGPPRMNATFDSALLNLAGNYNLNPLTDIEIM